MSHTIMTIIGFLFVFVMTALGAALVFCFKKGIPERLQTLFFGIATGVMSAAAVWSLIIPALEQSGFLTVGGGCLLGGVFMICLDFLAPKIPKESGLSQRSTKLFFAVTLHNIPEGLAVGFGFGAAYAAGTTAAYALALGLAFGIGLQNLPEGAAVSLPIKNDLNSNKKAFLYGLCSGLAEPIFAVVGFLTSATLTIIQPFLLSLSAGAMLFVVAEELLPACENEKTRKLGAWGFLIGFVIMMSLDVALGG